MSSSNGLTLTTGTNFKLGVSALNATSLLPANISSYIKSTVGISLLVKTTNKTNVILKKLYDELIQGYKYVKQYNINKNKILIKKIYNSNQISKPQYFNSKSFPEIIRTHIDKIMMAEISYSFSLYERNVKVIFIVENDDVDL